MFVASLRGKVDLEESVNAVEADAGHQLLRRQALERRVPAQLG